MSERPVIEERENGPLVVKEIPRLTGTNGDTLEARPVMALCRCGGSANKPFCDGSHNKNGFQSRGGTPAGRDRLLRYEGEELTVLYNPLLCSHAAECGRLASNIFDPSQRPWVQPDKGTVQQVEEVVRACPSGALQIEGRGHVVPETPGISVQKNGPYWVVDVDLDAPQAGEGASSGKMVLCRCGLSGNKPYCDGSHRDAGWSDE